MGDKEKKIKELLHALVDEATAACCEKDKIPTDLGRPVLITTLHRGVFFGYLVGEAGVTVKLRRARNVLYWSKDVGGFHGLAVTGPSDTCRVGPAVDAEYRDVTAVLECSDAAALAMEKAPWAK